MIQYQENLDALKKYRYNFYEKYMEVCDENRNQLNIQVDISEARDGNQIIIACKDEKKVRLNSQYRPIQEAQKWAMSFETGNIMVNAMMFGFGNGMFVKELLKRLKKDAKLFIYEPCLDIFVCAMRNFELTNIIKDERVGLCVQNVNMDEYELFVQSRAHWTNTESQICCQHTGYKELFWEDYMQFISIIQKTNDIVEVNKNTMAHFSEKMVINMLENLKYVKDSRYITDYVKLFPRNIPAIIVSAGPSLDKNIDLLKKAKGRAFILAVDTAMRQLIKHAIIPDAMVTLDAAKPFAYMNDPILRDIPLFCMLESNHEIMEFHKGIKIWFDGGSFLGDLFKRHGKQFTQYNTGGSVATGAFALCVSMEFHTIVLIGQDLAYAGDITHAGGEVCHVYNEEAGVRFVEGIDGNPVRTRQDWIIYRNWFEDAIKELKIQRKAKVIDATEGGALIHGSDIMTLEQVIETYCTKEIDSGKLLQSVRPAFDKEQFWGIKKEIIHYIDEIKEMREKAQEAAKDCDSVLKKNKQTNKYGISRNGRIAKQSSSSYTRS